MRCCVPLLADQIRSSYKLNCLLQIDEVQSEDDDSDGGPLNLTLRPLRFCSALQTLLASKSSAPFPIRLRHIARSCAVCSQDSGGMLKYLKAALRFP